MLRIGLGKVVRVAAGAAFVLAASATVSVADDVADFYRGKQITLLVGASTGGGYDSYARPVARHYGRFIPGEPTIVIKYMPAAAIIAANTLYTVSQRDGLTIGAVQRHIPFEPLLGEKQATYNAQEMSWLGSMNSEVGVTIVWHTAPHQTMKDVFTTPLIVASLGTGTDAETETAAMNKILGTKYQLIAGYKGTSEALLAMERGEVQGVHGVSWNYIRSQKADWLKDGSIRVLLQTSLKPAPDLPGVPTVYDFAKSDQDKKLLDLIMTQKEIARPYVLPPGVPAERVKALREGMDRMVKDPEFIAEIEKTRSELNYVSSAEVQDLINRVYQASPAEVEKWKEATGRK